MKVKKTQLAASFLSILYIVVAGSAYLRLFDDGYYTELIRHGQTTEKAVVPFYLPQPVDVWGLQRRALALFEYPLVNIVAVPIGIFLTVLLLARVQKAVLNRRN
jgi:hypothetical protein